ncbi:unnamed protein product, partial [Didymodactylos carnosus]
MKGTSNHDQERHLPCRRYPEVAGSRARQPSQLRRRSFWVGAAVQAGVPRQLPYLPRHHRDRLATARSGAG